MGQERRSSFRRRGSAARHNKNANILLNTRVTIFSLSIFFLTPRCLNSTEKCVDPGHALMHPGYAKISSLYRIIRVQCQNPCIFFEAFNCISDKGEGVLPLWTAA